MNEQQDNPRPKVSVIIPVYNVERYLDRCVRSVLGQTLREIEVILVDDGSPDGCPAICDAYAREDTRVRVVHKANAGLGMARNSGLDIATGEYVAFVDSDDFIDRRMYETLYRTAREHGLDTCYCGFAHRLPDGSLRRKTETDRYLEFRGRNEVDSFLLDMVGPEPEYGSDVRYMMCVWKALYSRGLIERGGVRFSSERQFVSEDIIFHIDYLRRAERVGFIPDTFYYYCVNGAVTLSNTYNREKFGRYKVFLGEVRRRLAAAYSPDKFECHYHRLCFLYLRAAVSKEVRQEKSVRKNLRIIKELTADPFFAPMFADYPYRRLPLKHRLLFYVMKHRLCFLTLGILKIRYK